jgi:hypothetical protein
MDDEKKEVQEKSVIPFVEGRGLVPNDFSGMYRLAQVMAASGVMPKEMTKPETLFVCLQYGFELGFTPMQAVQNIAVINGRPVVWGDAQLAMVRGSGLLTSFEERQEGEDENFKAIAIAYRKGDEKPTARSFSMKQAVKAGLASKDNWKKYPERMCQMRARSWTLRDLFPDVLKGLRTAADTDDADDLRPVITVVDDTPADTPEGKPDKKKTPTNKEEMYGSKAQPAGKNLQGKEIDTVIVDDDIDEPDLTKQEKDRAHPAFCPGCGHKKDECICPPETPVKDENSKTVIVKKEALKVTSETLGPEKKESFLPDDQYPDQAGDVTKQAPGKPEGQDEEILKNDTLTIGRPEWELASFKSARSGTFHKDTPVEKWTGFAKYVYENRKTWQSASITQRQAAGKKWAALYGDLPFLLDKFGDILTQYDINPPVVGHEKVEENETQPPEETESTSDTQEQTSETEAPDDAEMVRLDLIGKVAKAKYVHEAAYIVACDNLFESGLISTEKVSDMTSQEAELLLRAINARIDKENNS